MPYDYHKLPLGAQIEDYVEWMWCMYPARIACKLHFHPQRRCRERGTFIELHCILLVIAYGTYLMMIIQFTVCGDRKWNHVELS